MIHENIEIIDDQPINASFFREGKWLREYVTPGNLEVNNAANNVVGNLSVLSDQIRACQVYVGSMKYVPYIGGTCQIMGHIQTVKDLWVEPGLLVKIRVGNCANKSFLLTSMLRTFMQPTDVVCVLGNLYNGHASGHAWVQATIKGIDYVVEATRPDVPPVPAANAARYEPVHLFNDETVTAIPGKTVMTPFRACYSTWLKDYLDWSYINGGR